VKWLDAQGIAIQNVICLSGIAQTLFVDDRALRQETLARATPGSPTPATRRTGASCP
jgi:hypothetical protein